LGKKRGLKIAWHDRGRIIGKKAFQKGKRYYFFKGREHSERRKNVSIFGERGF